MVEFHNFETFDPDGPGLGNLFGQVSPAEALGIWPSGDFRLTPGDGAVPGARLLPGRLLRRESSSSTAWSSAGRRRETAVLSGVVAVAADLRARADSVGTPYTAAKAIVIAAPVRPWSS